MEPELSTTRLMEKWGYHQNHIDRRRKLLCDLRRQRYHPRKWLVFRGAPLDKTTYKAQRQFNLFTINEHRKAQRDWIRLYFR